jgi:adenine-specific DNA-methyltransferase
MKRRLAELQLRSSSRSDDGQVSDLVQARIAARAWSETLDEEWRINKAALFARKALEAFATVTCPDVRLSAPLARMDGSLDNSARELAGRIGRGACGLPLVEALHYLTSLYAALLPKRYRGELGAFYTPPALSARLFDVATEAGLDWRSARVLDPAAGGGAFLLQSASRMRAALKASNPAFALAQIGNRLLGLEIDPHAASLAQASLEILLSDLSRDGAKKIPTMVRVCDALEETPHAKFDLVIGNPPYGRVTLTEPQRARFSRSLYGHANLYGVFTDIAIRWAKPGALISYLTPTSMLGGQYYAALRGLLAAKAPPIAIDFVHARRGVFEDVLQETLLALYRKDAKPGRVQVHYLKVSGENEAAITRNGTIALPKDATLPWLAPRDPKHSSLIAHAEGMSDRFADWGYEISTGPLVWNRFKTQLRKKAGSNRFPLIWAEAVTADGRFVFRAEKKNHEPYFELRSGDEWLCVDTACVLVQRTTAKEQARRLIAAELPERFIRRHGGVVVENHLNMVRPKQKEVAVGPSAVAALLNSDIVDQVFRCISGSVAVSAFEMEALPLPSAAQMKPIERMLAEGASALAVEKAFRKLYGQKGAA